MASCLSPAEEVEGESSTQPNWLELPRDITQNILQRVGVVEIVTSACLVCPLWWNICKEPTMWCTIDMSNHHTSRYDFVKICMYAIDRSCGQVEDINIEWFGNNQLLQYIADSTSNLIRRLRIVKCWRISDEMLRKAAKNLPLLEELDISPFRISRDTLEVIAQSSPLLKSFKFRCVAHFPGDEGAFGISKMSRLHHLKLYGVGLSDDGMISILEGCPHLESLDIQDCLNLSLSECLVNICHAKIKDFLLSSNCYHELEDDSDSYQGDLVLDSDRDSLSEDSNGTTSWEYCHDHYDYWEYYPRYNSD